MRGKFKTQKAGAKLAGKRISEGLFKKNVLGLRGTT